MRLAVVSLTVHKEQTMGCVEEEYLDLLHLYTARETHYPDMHVAMSAVLLNSAGCLTGLFSISLSRIMASVTKSVSCKRGKKIC